MIRIVDSAKMAEVGESDGGGKGATFSRVLENLEADVTCGICFDQYREPKLLPCAHYFCRRCIRRVSEHAHGKPFPCPFCSEQTTLPMNGVDDLPTAYFVEHLLEVHRAMNANKEELRGPRKMTCDACKKDEGVVGSYCKECDQFLCGVCLDNHAKTALNARHTVESLDELRARRQRGSSRNMSFLGRSDSTASYVGHIRARTGSSFDVGDDKTKVYSMCPRHPEERIKIYCHDHDMVICRDCTVYDHPRGKCSTGFIRDEAPTTRHMLTDALAPVQEAHESISAAERDLGAVHEKVCADEVEQAAEVRRAFGEMRAHVDACEETLLAAVGAVSEGKKDALQGQKKALEISKQGVESTIEDMKGNINNLSEEEVLLAHKQLLMKMEKEMAQHKLRTLEPVTNADLVRVGPSPNDFPMRLGLAYPRFDLLRLKIKPPSLMYVGTKVEYKIEVPHSVNGHIKVEVQSSVDPGCVIKAVVTLKKGREEVLRGIVVAKYEVSFTPRVRGPHKLTMKINEQELPGSPFDIFAHISPTQLGFIVCQSPDAGKPYGIALSPEGLIIAVGNASKCLHFYSRDLKKARENFFSPKFHFPRGIACGSQPGVIYTTDKGIEKSRNYTIMKFVDGVLERGSMYGSRNVRLLKIIRGQIFVADEGNSQVHRFSQETLDHIGTFNVGPKASDPHDMAEYNDQLYVLGNTKLALFSFDEWKFLGNVPLGATMSVMRGICFDRTGNMFITQAGPGVKGVYVFEPTGALITSFGHFMDRPLGIVIDDDGFVYVTDHKEKNRRVFAF
jgi:hypothetical protein